MCHLEALDETFQKVNDDPIIRPMQIRSHIKIASIWSEMSKITKFDFTD